MDYESAQDDENLYRIVTMNEDPETAAKIGLIVTSAL
jgi:hypothetical protein